jgi:hypothetical protein
MAAGARIARERPDLAGRIAARILEVETAHYELHGCPSPECGRIACGHAIDALAAIFDELEERRPVVEFVRRQLACPRRQVRDKAQRFLKRHGGSEEP